MRRDFLAGVVALWAACGAVLGAEQAIAQQLGAQQTGGQQGGAQQDAAFSALARVEIADSGLSEGWRGAAQLRLALSQGVPWRVFTLDAPRRVVLDFREVDWGALTAADLGAAEGISAVRFGTYRPGWSRMVLDLEAAMTVEAAEMAIDEGRGTAVLSLTLAPGNAADFAAAAGAPYDPRWDLPAPAVAAPEEKTDWAATVVVIDPGHGGIDPGAERGTVQEKDLMLSFARELRDVLRRTGGFEVVLTRDADVFVSLEGRVAIAHQHQADVFISLHADSVSQGNAKGATFYTLSEEASDAASALLAERHDRADIISGVDLSGADDEVTDVLLDLARMETEPRTFKLAQSLVGGLKDSTVRLNSKPLREGAFSVLKAADVPSVLVELGFMSSKQDLANLKDPGWRAAMAAGLRDGLVAWVAEDKATRALVRQ
ncbi:N-acetylmuramoyl-L-alanine amidase [Shimia marina]|uniref:N-acetylmuramoyl-L-alanine amidase n=1 Tax=Shimia marina TaxID=321267 RepID=A0A0P1ERM4_9RHOB|nr:N-acetylmuramoyl-L-alanine amidase [Shimia marina]CUH52990.1 N-acetylmuramoyl-L-alanine amidase AmiC precursor [Shimia marina]SFD91894.1 N-acetylmuramoyl-L-alanine amidase [Shimia marina]